MKKNVLLLGAGSALPWNAPNTSKLTDKIISDNYFKTIMNKPVGSYIYECLNNHDENNKKIINFETIIDLIEFLFDYFNSRFRHPKNYKTPVGNSIISINQEFAEQLFSFNKIYRINSNGWYIIEDNTEICYSKSDKCEQILRYLRLLHNRYNDIIVNEVKNYCSNDNINDVTFNDLNGCLKDFINKCLS